MSTKGQQIWNSTRSKVSSFAMWCCRWVYNFVLQLKISGRSLWPRGDVPPVSTFDQQLADHLLADHHLGDDHPPGQRLLQELPGRRHPSQPHRPPPSGNFVSCQEFFLIHYFSYSFVGLSRTLPTTAYAKMIDIWMIFCMFNPFFEVC